MRKRCGYLLLSLPLLASMPCQASVIVYHCVVGSQNTTHYTLETPPGWTLYPAPDSESDAMACAYYSKSDWVVKLEDRRVRISLLPQTLKDDRQQLPFELKPTDVAPGLDGVRFISGYCRVKGVSDGYLVAFYAGGWGGTLHWFNQAGTRHEKLVDGPIVSLGTLSTMVVAVKQALGDDGKGEALQIVKRDTGWAAVPFATIPSNPRLTVTESDHSMLIITQQGLFRLRASGEVESIIRTNYDGLYPNSMVRSDSGAVYIGMRHFVTRLVPSGGEWLEQWLIPEDCTRFQLDEKLMECVCVGKENH